MFCVIVAIETCSLMCYSQSYAILSNRDLVLVDEVNCQIQVIGKCNSTLHDIAIHPVSKELYGSSNNGTIHKIDKSTGQLTFLGYNRQGFNALAFSSIGLLYAMSGDSDSLFSINTLTGQAHNLGSTGTGVFSSGDLTFYKNSLYLAGKGGKLVQIDLGNISNSRVIGLFSSLNSVYGINTMGCDEGVYAFQSNDLYKLSPTNLLNSTLHCSNLFSGTVNGATSLNESVDWNKLGLGHDTTLCDQDTLLLDVGIPGGSYRWHDNSTASTYQVTQPGLYYVEIMFNNCIFTDSIDIQYDKFNGLSLGSDTTICRGDNIQLDVFYPKADYLWFDGTKTSVNMVTGPGLYWVQLSVDGCLWSDTIRVDVFAEPDYHLGEDTVLCSTDSLTIGTDCMGCSYLWNTNSIDSKITINQPGEYWRVVNKGACSYADTIVVSVYKKEHLKDTIGCEGDVFVISVNIEEASYLWSDGSTSGEILVHKSGEFWVDVIHKCFAYRDSITIHYKDCSCNVFIPNAFSPNGDGLNDHFFIGTVCQFETFSLNIYNRWGELIFNSNSPEQMWGGDFGNSPGMVGVYVWKLRYKTIRGEDDVLDGKVHLLR